MRFVLAAALGFVVIAAAIPLSAIADERSDFHAMCERVSRADGVSAEAITPFCSCLTDRATQDAALYRELWAAATAEPNLDARMAMLSEPGRAAVQACRAPPR